eukprot:1267838-Rhodomonas_salina.1
MPQELPSPWNKLRWAPSSPLARVIPVLAVTVLASAGHAECRAGWGCSSLVSRLRSSSYLGSRTREASPCDHWHGTSKELEYRTVRAQPGVGGSVEKDGNRDSLSDYESDDNIFLLLHDERTKPQATYNLHELVKGKR